MRDAVSPSGQKSISSQPLSYYSDATLSQRLRLSAPRLAQARCELIALDLIAYDPPLYQVLSLPGTVPTSVHLKRLHAVLEGRS